MDQQENYNSMNGGVQLPPYGEGYRHPSFVKREVARIYNRTGGAFLLHFLILNALQLIVLGCMGYSNIVAQMAMGEAADTGRLSLMMVLSVAVAYVIANISSSFIGLHFSRRLKGSSDLFKKSELGAPAIISAMLVTLGIQGISLVLQITYILLSGDSGMSDSTAQLLSFGNDTATDVILFIYMVFFGPITEEIIFRGMALKNFSAVNRRFAIVFSSLCFGLFHGNVLQFIVGFLLGMFFSYIDIKANSLIPSIILHIFNNLTSASMSIIFLDASEETATVAQIIYIIGCIVLGIVGFILIRGQLFRKDKEEPIESENTKHDVYPEFLAAEIQGMDGLTWKTAAKSPCLWIFAVIYLITILSPILLNSLSDVFTIQ